MSNIIASLPDGILFQVLLELPDVDSLIAAIQVFCSPQDTLSYYPYQILHSLLKKSCIRTNPSLIPSQFAQVYRDLIRVVALPCVPAQTLYRLVIDAWELFRTQRTEDILIPVVRRLASRFHDDGSIPDAIDILEKLWDGITPFEWSGWTAYSSLKKQRRIRREMERGVLTPIRYLLTKLYFLDPKPEYRKRLISFSKISTLSYDGMGKIVSVEEEIRPLEVHPYDDHCEELDSSGLAFEDRPHCSPALLVRVYYWPRECMISPAARMLGDLERQRLSFHRSIYPLIH